MPLAQNYKDDVTLLEAKPGFGKSTIGPFGRESSHPPRFHMNVNRGVTFIKHGATSNTVNIIADDDLPDIDLVLPHKNEHHTFYLSSCESGTGIDIQDSNLSSQRSSTSSTYSCTHVESSTGISPLQSNSFLRVLKHLHSLTLRRRKHGRYGTLSSSLHLFFKKPHHSSLSQFYKSPSTSELTANTDKNHLCKRTTSHPQLHMIDTIKGSRSDMKNNVFNTRRLLLRRLRASDKTVSEDNNTNTMSSLDLATVPSLVLTTDSNASFPSVQRNISSDMNYVSDLFLSNNSHLIYSTDVIVQHKRYYL
ncbi:unnamed protein product [Adineta ricciae]|uniref:Uncharacterized protein n=1 Tax=Adineta ricciae TaxID=249248 RepID=A0A814A2V6_ADIRI|nr:unnamed protein product [Adineta ricciae]